MRRQLLTAEQGKRLLATASRDSLRGKRDYAMLAMLSAADSGAASCLSLHADSIRLREEHLLRIERRIDFLLYHL